MPTRWWVRMTERFTLFDYSGGTPVTAGLVLAELDTDVTVDTTVVRQLLDMRCILSGNGPGWSPEEQTWQIGNFQTVGVGVVSGINPGPIEPFGGIDPRVTGTGQLQFRQRIPPAANGDFSAGCWELPSMDVRGMRKSPDAGSAPKAQLVFQMNPEGSEMPSGSNWELQVMFSYRVLFERP